MTALGWLLSRTLHRSPAKGENTHGSIYPTSPTSALDELHVKFDSKHRAANGQALADA